jgi:hypothetical protein
MDIIDTETYGKRFLDALIFNGHGIHGRTRKNKCLIENISVFFRGFRGHNICLYQIEAEKNWLIFQERI